MNFKTVAILALSSALLLTGCQAHEDAKKSKQNLEEKNYTVSTYTADEYAKMEIAKTIVVEGGLETHLVAINKDKTSVVVSWHFKTIDQTSKFFDANSTKLITFAQSLGDIGEDSTVGTHNNVAYAGSRDAIKIAGYTLD